MSSTSYRSGAAEDGVFSFAGGDGDLIVCGTIRWVTDIRPIGDAQPMTVGDDELGPSVPAGTYIRAERLGVRQACFNVPPTCPCPTIASLDGGVYMAAAVPA